MPQHTTVPFTQAELDPFGFGVDQLGRPLTNPGAISAAIPAWHPRNEGEGGGGGGEGGEGGGGEGGEGGGGEGGGAGGSGDEWTPPTKEEYERLQQAAGRSEAERRRLAKEKEDADRRAAEEKGEHQRLYEQEKAAREALEAERATERKTNLISSAAGKLNFHDPEDAARLLDSDVVDKIENAADAERELKKLAGRKKHLVKPEPRRQRPVPAGGGGDGGDEGDDAVGVDRIRNHYERTSAANSGT